MTKSLSKDRHPLKLDSSAAGHVDPGESYYRTAVRELEEELSLDAEIHEALKIAACEATGNEHVTLFTAVTNKEPKPNPDEIVWGEFMSRETVDRLMEEDPGDFVPAFILLWKEFLRKTT
jgi:16S rRNA (adenine1518-N6/adenine1519-N6)-dimethyltransferase